MKIGIAGAGAIAMGYAALLMQNGHEVMVWSPSGQRTRALIDGMPLTVMGAVEGEFRPAICQAPVDLATNDVIILALPAYGHRMVIDSLVPHLSPRHTVIISGHLSFAALYLSKTLAARDLRLPIIAWNTTVVTAKAVSFAEIKVGTIRRKVNVASLPSSTIDAALAVCSHLFGEIFVGKDDILTVVLSNINPESHLGTALCNITRIELGETWGQRAKMTPSVGRFVEALDRERIAIADAMGKSVPSILNHYENSFGIEADSVSAASRMLVDRGSDPMGPKEMSTRYVLEDVPFGLVPLLKLAEITGVEAPLHRSGIEILSACYGYDFICANDLIGELDMDSLAAFKERVKYGY